MLVRRFHELFKRLDCPFEIFSEPFERFRYPFGIFLWPVRTVWLPVQNFLWAVRTVWLPVRNFPRAVRTAKLPVRNTLSPVRTLIETRLKRLGDLFVTRSMAVRFTHVTESRYSTFLRERSQLSDTLSIFKKKIRRINICSLIGQDSSCNNCFLCQN